MGDEQHIEGETAPPTLQFVRFFESFVAFFLVLSGVDFLTFPPINIEE